MIRPLVYCIKMKRAHVALSFHRVSYQYFSIYIGIKTIPSSTNPRKGKKKKSIRSNSYYESLNVLSKLTYTYSRVKKIHRTILTSMDQYPSSLVDTSLDLTIGVTRMRVEEDSTVCFSCIVVSLHLQFT